MECVEVDFRDNLITAENIDALYNLRLFSKNDFVL